VPPQREHLLDQLTQRVRPRVAIRVFPQTPFLPPLTTDPAVPVTAEGAIETGTHDHGSAQGAALSRGTRSYAARREVRGKQRCAAAFAVKREHRARGEEAHSPV
jgi:hypothetical protein